MNENQLEKCIIAYKAWQEVENPEPDKQQKRLITMRHNRYLNACFHAGLDPDKLAAVLRRQIGGRR